MTTLDLAEMLTGYVMTGEHRPSVSDPERWRAACSILGRAIDVLGVSALTADQARRYLRVLNQKVHESEGDSLVLPGASVVRAAPALARRVCPESGVTLGNVVTYYGMLGQPRGSEAAKKAFPEVYRELQRGCPVCGQMHYWAVAQSEWGPLLT